MVRQEEKRPFSEAECGDVGPKALVVPHEFRAEDVAVVGEVPGKVPGADVQVLEALERRPHDPGWPGDAYPAFGR